MIQVENLTKHYGSIRAVDGLSFSVAKGRILGLLGPNGAGKTTTMKILTGHLPRDGGRVLIAGRDPETDPLALRSRLGYLPEHTPIYLEMFVDEYLDFAARIKNHSSITKAGRKAQVEKAVADCGLEPVFRRRIGNLSKGFRQRVGLAQALIGEPEILILDEPTIGLDPSQIVEIRDLIKSLAGDKTIILSTHILPEVSQTCDQVVIISGGRLVAQDTPLALTGDSAEGLVLEVEVSGNEEAIKAIMAGLTGVISTSDRLRPGLWRLKAEPGQDPRAGLVRELVTAGVEIRELRVIKRTLEQAFVSLITGDGQGVAAGKGGGHD